MSQRRNTYFVREIVRAAYLAGGGHGAGEIAAEINATPAAVYALCQRNRIKLISKGPNQVAIVMAVARSAVDEIARLAHKRRVDPVWMAARVLEACAAEPVLLRNLIDEVDDA